MVALTVGQSEKKASQPLGTYKFGSSQSTPYADTVKGVIASGDGAPKNTLEIKDISKPMKEMTMEEKALAKIAKK